jgi:predicted metal-dependent phosphoesterase TrpH
MPSRGAIDLHTHSSVSDGTETPTQLIEAAVEAKLRAVAITDHDSTAGWREAFDAATGTGLMVVPGMELSTNYGPASVHMLGYLFDPANPGIVAETAKIRDGRMHRAERIVERIAKDYGITWADVLAQSIVRISRTLSSRTATSPIVVPRSRRSCTGRAATTRSIMRRRRWRGCG